MDRCAARQSHRLHQLVHPSRRNTADPGLLDYRDQRLLRHLLRLEERREVAPLPQLRYPQLKRSQPRVEHTIAMPVAPGRPLATGVHSARRRSGPPHPLPSATATRPPPPIAENHPHQPSPTDRIAPISLRSSYLLSATVEGRNSTLADRADGHLRLHHCATPQRAPNFHHLRGR